MRYLTVSQAAERLQLSVPTVKRYIYDGRLNSCKLPGGQHRIPESEIERLLSPEEAGGEAESETGADATEEERIAVLERWATELEREVERLGAALEVLSRYCEGASISDAPEAEPLRRGMVQVLGPGCRRCDALHELTHRVLRQMGMTDVVVEHVTDLGRIVAWGPVLTPALVINGEIVLSGRVPEEAELLELLECHLT